MPLTKSEQRLMNEGAERERRAVRSFMRRKYEREIDWISVAEFKVWLLGRTKRYRKAKGGLGG